MSLTDLMTMAKSDKKLQRKILGQLWMVHPDECYQCMRCTSGCTSLKLLELKPHEITLLVNSGFIEELVSSDIIWTCASCLKCKERCPQKASPYNTIMALRNLAVEREAQIPEAYMRAISQILETGLMQQVQTVASKDNQPLNRETLGLPEMRGPDDKFQAVFIEVLGG
ncbi:MAG: 4Fe-4S dicluster domain-containing protein [Candidatus Bathyarchaeota archaeon]|nr:MAG: 4Fe-4S dicluster domain-containing protein [Candidatus Bathyarchaeota archaeon]